MTDQQFLDHAIELARENVEAGGRPFGAVLVRDGQIIARAVNRIAADHDPTAHAELLALRAAGATLKTPRLDGCHVYASGQPCPMCLAAMRIAGISKIVFAYSNADGEAFGMSTAGIAAELSQPLDVQDWASIGNLPPEDHASPAIYQRWAELAAQGR